MSAVWIAACLWVLAASATAMLPMRRQMVPGLALLIAAPLLIVWIGAVQGVWLALLALAGFVSMFRNPLIYFARRAAGLPDRDRAPPPAAAPPQPEDRR